MSKEHRSEGARFFLTSNPKYRSMRILLWGSNSHQDTTVGELALLASYSFGGIGIWLCKNKLIRVLLRRSTLDQFQARGITAPSLQYAAVSKVTPLWRSNWTPLPRNFDTPEGTALGELIVNKRIPFWGSSLSTKGHCSSLSRSSDQAVKHCRLFISITAWGFLFLHTFILGRLQGHLFYALDLLCKTPTSISSINAAAAAALIQRSIQEVKPRASHRRLHVPYRQTKRAISSLSLSLQLQDMRAH